MATKEHKLIIFYWNVHDSKKDEKCYNIKQDNKIHTLCEKFFSWCFSVSYASKCFTKIM